MNEPIYVKPAQPGLRVRLADGTIVPAEGIEARRDTHVERRIRDGDLVVTRKPAARREKDD